MLEMFTYFEHGSFRLSCSFLQPLAHLPTPLGGWCTCPHPRGAGKPRGSGTLPHIPGGADEPPHTPGELVHLPKPWGASEPPHTAGGLTHLPTPLGSIHPSWGWC